MNHGNQQIFRASALLRHRHAQAESVLPCLISTRLFHRLWFVMGLLIASGVLIWIWGSRILAHE
jgi:hypothetical protein